jgi:hypothetical protein
MNKENKAKSQEPRAKRSKEAKKQREETAGSARAQGQRAKKN